LYHLLSSSSLSEGHRLPLQQYSQGGGDHRRYVKTSEAGRYMVDGGGAVYMTRTSSQILRRVRRRISIVEGRRWIEILNH
ncbi:unnamed protein product, partial [Musa hybrid cultivar]